MALATTIVGDGILVAYNTSKRRWQVYQHAGTYLWFTETTAEEVREWVALTEAIAKSTAETATQPELPSVATYAASEDQRTIGAYKLTKTTITVTVALDP